jgi:nucleotide-binding universal stress UspA family protein
MEEDRREPAMTMLVGTDGTDCGTAAVEWAATEAQRRRAALRIVHAFDWDWHDSRFDIGNEYIDVGRHLAPWRDKYPGVAGETVRTHDSAASALVLGSRTSRLVVVGSGGHGTVGGSLLGAVGLQLLHHAASPVLIVRGEAGR